MRVSLVPVVLFLSALSLTNNKFAVSNTNGITLTNADGIRITDNTFTNAGGTNAINIDAATDAAYVAGNTLGGLAIVNSGTNTSYGGQVDSSGNYQVQPAGTIQLLKNTKVTGNLTVTGSIDQASATTLNIGTSNATAISIGQAGVTTTLNGNTLEKATSSTAFQIQNASSSVLFTADTSSMQVVIGNSGNTVTLSSSGVSLAGNARATRKITLTPEYAGAVLDSSDTGGVNCSANNSGIMTSGYATGITGFGNTTQNFYKWTTSAGTAQCYDVILQVPVPSDFSAWGSSTPITINTYTSSTSTGPLNMAVIDTSGSTESSCNYAAVTPGSNSTWATTGSSCTISGTYAAGSYMTIKVRMTSPSGGDTRIGNIVLTYKSSF